MAQRTLQTHGKGRCMASVNHRSPVPPPGAGQLLREAEGLFLGIPEPPSKLFPGICCSMPPPEPAQQPPAQEKPLLPPSLPTPRAVAQASLVLPSGPCAQLSNRSSRPLLHSNLATAVPGKEHKLEAGRPTQPELEPCLFKQTQAGRLLKVEMNGPTPQAFQRANGPEAWVLPTRVQREPWVPDAASHRCRSWDLPRGASV